MAVTKLLNIKSSLRGAGRHLFNSIRYIMNPEKTKGGLLVGGNAGATWHEVYQTMKETKREWGKTDGRQGYHFVMSWKPGEVDEETAYQVVKEFCEEYLGDNYEYVFSIHNDKDHMHGHIVFNSVNRMNGYKYHYKKGDWEKGIQPITDKICVQHGLKKLTYNSEKKGKSYAETMATKTGKNNWSKIIRADIDYAISQSDTYHDFLEILRRFEYQIESRNIKGKQELALTVPGQGNARRTSNLGAGYFLADIKARIGNEKEIQELPKSPKLKYCAVKSPIKKHSFLSRYQVKRVRELNQIHTRFVKNPYAVNQAQIRKSLLRIDRLSEDCRYLIRMNIHSSDALTDREEVLKSEERFFRAQKESMHLLDEDEVYDKYVELQAQLSLIQEGDDGFEVIEDQIELLEERLPFGSEDTGKKLSSINAQLAQIRQEKRIIRHIKKEERQGIKSISLYVSKEKKNGIKREGRRDVWPKK